MKQFITLLVIIFLSACDTPPGTTSSHASEAITAEAILELPDGLPLDGRSRLHIPAGIMEMNGERYQGDAIIEDLIPEDIPLSGLAIKMLSISPDTPAKAPDFSFAIHSRQQEPGFALTPGRYPFISASPESLAQTTHPRFVTLGATSQEQWEQYFAPYPLQTGELVIESTTAIDAPEEDERSLQSIVARFRIVLMDAETPVEITGEVQSLDSYIP